jgi:hypothetical protein
MDATNSPLGTRRHLGRGWFDTAGGSFTSILGGFENSTSAFESTVSGGENNTASANGASVLGGHGNNASSNCQAIPAAPGSC